VTAASRPSTLAVYRRLLPLMEPYWVPLAGVMLLSLMATPVALLAPLPLKIVADNVLGGKPLSWRPVTSVLAAEPAGGSALLVALALLIAVALLNQLQGVASWVLQAYTGERLVLNFRSRLFRHVQRLSLTYHDSCGSSESTYRIQHDAAAIQSLALGVLPIVTSSLTLVAMMVVTARMDLSLALLASAVVPPLFVLIQASGGYLRDQWNEIKRFESSAMGVVHEVLGSLRVVKAFGQEDREQARFVEQSARSVRGQMRLAWTQGVFDLLVGGAIAAVMAAALYLGARHVQAGLLSLGDLLVVMAYLAQVMGPVETITKRVNQLQAAVASAERALALLDQAADVVERPDARPITRAAGAVAFRHVTFGYERGQTVLHDVSFSMPAGTRVGIAGRTGAGKTTLLNLLTRFFDPAAGAILLDGIDLREYRVADLRNQFAIVLQDAVLFSSTIAENIAYARPSATMDEIVEAAKAASAHDFISALPDEYHTVVGERGLRLSGGERQRVSLARAFLKDAPILLCDEPTSAVDVVTEAEIMAAMERLMVGRTVFTIAHRLSTLDRCDARLVVDDGRVSSVASLSGDRQLTTGAWNLS
jgi:ATP-binding cassette subfamily B protein